MKSALMALAALAASCAALAASCGTGLAADLPLVPEAPTGARYVSLECVNLRRLADNELLDLRLRFVFDQRRHSYLRYENAGRGWQLVGPRPYLGVDAARVGLEQNREVTAYIERLTGDYYYIDRSGTTLSLWGRCNLATPLHNEF